MNAAVLSPFFLFYADFQDFHLSDAHGDFRGDFVSNPTVHQSASHGAVGRDLSLLRIGLSRTHKRINEFFFVSQIFDGHRGAG